MGDLAVGPAAEVIRRGRDPVAAAQDFRDAAPAGIGQAARLILPEADRESRAEPDLVPAPIQGHPEHSAPAILPQATIVLPAANGKGEPRGRIRVFRLLFALNQ